MDARGSGPSTLNIFSLSSILPTVFSFTLNSVLWWCIFICLWCGASKYAAQNYLLVCRTARALVDFSRAVSVPQQVQEFSPQGFFLQLAIRFKELLIGVILSFLPPVFLRNNTAAKLHKSLLTPSKGWTGYKKIYQQVAQELLSTARFSSTPQNCPEFHFPPPVTFGTLTGAAQALQHKQLYVLQHISSTAKGRAECLLGPAVILLTK